MVSTEVAICRLRQSVATQQLEKIEALQDCVNTVTSQPGCLQVIYATLIEDPSTLVWIVEWETREHHTGIFAKSTVYSAFCRRFSTFLAEKDPLVSLLHYKLNPAISQCLSSQHPVLEICSFVLSDGHTLANTLGLLTPVCDILRNEGHPEAWSTAQEPDTSSHAIHVAGWKDVEEHYTVKRSHETFIPTFMKAKQHWSTISLFGHIQPLRK